MIANWDCQCHHIEGKQTSVGVGLGKWWQSVEHSQLGSQQGIPAWKGPPLPEIFNSAPQEKLGFPNMLSQLICEPATTFSPIAASQRHNTALSRLPRAQSGVKPNCISVQRLSVP